uniref:Uncharacterized protein n=1 Tax=Callithrix jacchus TaxID=9483 RepID=A0A8I3WFS4_CALJA
LLKIAKTVSLKIAGFCIRSSGWSFFSATLFFEVYTICRMISIVCFYLMSVFRVINIISCISASCSLFIFLSLFFSMAQSWLT